MTYLYIPILLILLNEILFSIHYVYPLPIWLTLQTTTVEIIPYIGIGSRLDVDDLSSILIQLFVICFCSSQHVVISDESLLCISQFFICLAGGIYLCLAIIVVLYRTDGINLCNDGICSSQICGGLFCSIF